MVLHNSFIHSFTTLFLTVSPIDIYPNTFIIHLSISKFIYPFIQQLISFTVQADRWMLTSYSPVLDSSGLETSTLGLGFLVLPDHFRGPGGELWVECRASMPSIQGVDMTLDRTLLLGTRKRTGDTQQGGWTSSGTRGNTYRKH